jgi:hypothetical protein
MTLHFRAAVLLSGAQARASVCRGTFSRKRGFADIVRRGILLSELIRRTSTELRLVSLADGAVGLQLFSLDRDGIDARLEASFSMAGLSMEPLRLEPDLGAWRTEGSDKGVAMAGSATLSRRKFGLRVGNTVLLPERPFSLRWVWRWRSVSDCIHAIHKQDSTVADQLRVNDTQWGPSDPEISMGMKGCFRGLSSSTALRKSSGDFTAT